MKTQKPLTLEQTLDALHQSAEDSAALDEVLAMKSEEVDAELAKAGVDIDALDARLAVREAEIRRAHAPVAKRRMVSARLAASLVAAATAIGGIGGSLVEGLLTASRLPLPTYSAPPPTAAAELRSKGFEACGRGRFRDCLDDFNKAKALDPDGDADVEVQSARAAAESALHH
jgi:hypothetical protein